MSASKDEGKAPTGRPGDKHEPASAPAKPGATGSSAVTPGPAKPAPAQGGVAPKAGATDPGIAALTGGKAAVPSPAPTKPGATDSSAIKPAPSSPAGATGSAGTPPSPGAAPAKPGATDSSAVKPATPVQAASGSAAGPAAADKPAIPSAGAAKPGPTGSSAVPTGGATPSGGASIGKSGEAWLSAQPAKPGPAAGGATPEPSGKPKSAGESGLASAPPGGAGAQASAKTEAAKPEPAKPEPAKPEPAKPEPAKPEPAKPDLAKPAGGPAVATRLGSGETPADGPILDMKAKRLPDPAAAPAASRPPAPDAKPPSGFVDADAPNRGLGFSAVLAAGLLGGILGAGLVFTTLQWGASGPRQDVRADSPVEARLTALDKRIGGLATGDALAALDSRVAANERAVKGLPEAVKSASDRAEQALQKTSTAPAAGSGTAAPAASAAPGDLVARLDALDQRVAALQEEPGRDQPADSKLTTPQGGDESVRLADFEERLKAIEAKAEADPEGPSPELTQKLAALQGQIESGMKSNETADQGLGQRLDQLQQALDAKVGAATAAIAAATDSSKQAVEAGRAQAAEAAKAADARLQEQAGRLAALDKAVEGSAKAATMQAALRAIAAGRIADALDRGAPYAEALASLRASGTGDPKQIAALEPYAASGAPTAASLAAAFRPVSDGIAAARRAARAKTVAETGSVGDRLMSMAESVIQVKRVGAPTPQGAAAGTAPPPESDPAATVQDALDRGRIVEAAQAFAGLPEEVRGQAGVFGGRLKARAEAALAAQALQADAFQALSPASAGR